MLARIPAGGLAAMILLPVLVRADDAPKSDKDLEGDWKVVSVVHRLLDDTPPSIQDDTVLSIKGGVATVKVGKESFSGTINVDTSKNPRTFDLTVQAGEYKVKPVYGLYEVKGDDLRFCLGQPGAARPKQLVPDLPTDEFLFTMVRVKK